MLNKENIVFKGGTLKDSDLPRIGSQIGVGEDIIHAIIDTETNNKWVDKLGRLPILYEPHVAFRAATSDEVRSKLVKMGLAYPKWGTKPYPADSYVSFWKAFSVDPETACRATSWGGPQILGEEYKRTKYKSALSMVESFLVSQTNQLQAMIDFIQSKKLDVHLKKLQAKINSGIRVTADDARDFVRGYNGNGYEKNQYHVKFAANLNKWLKIKDTFYTKDFYDNPEFYRGNYFEELFAIQTTLDEIGYPEVGTIDGKWGTRTAAAILAFRQDNNLPTIAKIDKDFLTKLALKPKRYIAPERVDATLDKLRKNNDKAVIETDQTERLGKVTVGAGGLIAIKELLEQFTGVSESTKVIVDAIAPLQKLITDNIWLVAILVGGFIIYKSEIINKIRLSKHQSGQDVSQ